MTFKKNLHIDRIIGVWC